jgi:hypothetical protein
MQKIFEHDSETSISEQKEESVNFLDIMPFRSHSTGFITNVSSQSNSLKTDKMSNSKKKTLLAGNLIYTTSETSFNNNNNNNNNNYYIDKNVSNINYYDKNVINNSKPPKWLVKDTTRFTTSNMNLSKSSLTRPDLIYSCTSNKSLHSTKSSLSTSASCTSLSKRIKTFDDVKIAMNDEQLEEFKKIMEISFKKV